MTPRVLVVRLDSDGDVLLAGPAVRAVARRARVTLLVSPAGRQAAALLPGVDEVLVWDCPWTGFDPPPVDAADTLRLVDAVRARGFDAGLVLTSAQQSPLPAALLLRLAGLPRLAAISPDYPGSLLDLRHQVPGEVHEVRRALSLAEAAGFPAGTDPAGDRLAVRLPSRPLPEPVRREVPDGGYVVVHPGASVPARAPSPGHAAAIVAALARTRTVLVTGGPAEQALTARVAGRHGVDLGGRTGFAELAAVLAGADVTVCGNTGPAHLSAAVGTPVVSLFAPVVPATRWAPWGVPSVLLGDQHAGCAGSRARRCPVPGHPCLGGVAPAEVVAAVDALAPEREAAGSVAAQADRLVELEGGAA